MLTLEGSPLAAILQSGVELPGSMTLLIEDKAGLIEGQAGAATRPAHMFTVLGAILEKIT
jgi:hypothetical protein